MDRADYILRDGDHFTGIFLQFWAHNPNLTDSSLFELNPLRPSDAYIKGGSDNEGPWLNWVWKWILIIEMVKTIWAAVTEFS